MAGLTLSLAAAASAQLPEPPMVPNDPTTPGGTLDQSLDQPGETADTDATPKAKETDLWKQVAGAIFPKGAADPTRMVEGSATAYDTDLFTVSFRTLDRGFAGGARCASDPERGPEEPLEDYGRRVGRCTRVAGEGVPVIYRYSEPSDGDPSWERMPVSGESRPGYVGAIAWIDSDTAIAVGGDGVYPRREVARGPTETYAEWVARDPAGRGRAWVYDAGSGERWRELDLEGLTAPCDAPGEELCGMRGMSALAFHPTIDPELGFAGALGQIWKWQGGQFTEKVDRDSGPEKITGPGFDYRVRELRFLPGTQKPQAFGVTAGCCAEVGTKNDPHILAYDGINAFAVPRWHVRSLGVDARNAAGVASVDEPLDLGEPGNDAHRLNLSPHVPDSFYSSMVTGASAGNGGIAMMSVLATPGGPEAGGERASILSRRFCPNGQGEQPVGVTGTALLESGQEAIRTSLSTARLVAADGDSATGVGRLDSSTGESKFTGRPSTLALDSFCSNPNPPTTDGIPDWMVGELRSTRLQAFGARALAVTTDAAGLAPDTVDTDTGAAANSPTGYEPTDQPKAEAYLKSQSYLLPSYSLNEIEFPGNAGIGWAVGDHGGILKLGGEGPTSELNEPEPPRLGSRAPLAIDDGEALRAAKPPVPGGSPGPVPALESRPTRRLPEPRMIGAGYADPSRPAPDVRSGPAEDVRQIVMSRDGGEGWAIGTTDTANLRTQPVLYHFDGSAWSRCDPQGITGVLPPDPACASVAGLRRYVQSGIALASNLIAAARVPLEKDSDPSNDDEFELVAVGARYPERAGESPTAPALIRYRKGRWDFEPAERRAQVTGTGSQPFTDIAFTAPDDGWLVGPGAASAYPLFHYDGEHWVDCGKAADRCGDASGRTAFATAATGGNSVDTVAGIEAAGDRVYLYGTRRGGDGNDYPMVIYHERGASSWRGSPDGSGGSFDPGFDGDGDGLPDGDPGAQGSIDSVAVAAGAGGYRGWAVGAFGDASEAGAAGVDLSIARGSVETTLMRLGPDGSWGRFDDAGPIRDYLGPYATGTVAGKPTTNPRLQVTLPPSGEAEGEAFIAQEETGRLFRFDPERERWEVVATERPEGRWPTLVDGGVDGRTQALAPDGQGGVWAAVLNHQTLNNGGHDYFFRFTDRAPADVFTEAPNPFAGGQERVTGLAGAPDGAVWAATNSSTLYRYDRALGWSRARVPGWDPGRVVTRSSEMNAIAVGQNGEGVAVGKAGRIADFTPGTLRLDLAAGAPLCSSGVSPCGTGRDLRSAAVAPDGSAIVGGDQLSLLWRPAGGQFSSIPKPVAPGSSTITGASMPAPDRAYLVTDRGALFAGEMAGPGQWSWRLENRTGPGGQSGELLSLDEQRVALPLRDVEVDSSGRGYAVGDQGLVLERSPGADPPWRRPRTPYLDDFRSVALGAGGGDGALIGANMGLILTADAGRLRVARAAEYYSGLGGASFVDNAGGRGSGTQRGPVIGLALLPGVGEGQSEAWAALTAPREGDGTNRLLHYASDETEPLLDPGRHLTKALPDAPPRRPGELSVAAFGKSECDESSSSDARNVCLYPQGTTMSYEIVARRVAEELRERFGSGRGPDLAVLSGDAVDSGGQVGQAATERGEGQVNVRGGGTQEARQLSGPQKLRRYYELYARPLAEAGVPLYGAIGGQDLSEAYACTDVLATGCQAGSRNATSAGENLAWRHAFAPMAAPWGSAEPPGGGVLSYTPVPDSPDAEPAEDLAVEDPTGAGEGTRVRLAGARTHYAVDISRQEEKVARLIVLDSSSGAIQTSDPAQNPREPDGQLAWLERVACVEGSGEGCTRHPGQAAIVVTEAPTYSYGPGGLAATMSPGDALLFEQALFRHRVSAVISGRLGWNGLYYATAPSLHEPGPGGGYPEAPPDPLPTGERPIPFAIASSAGGKFADDARRSAQTPAENGFWHGYSLVRVPTGEDGGEVVVEQRPIHDWIRISPEGGRHLLRAGKRLELNGAGREPIGYSRAGAAASLTTRLDELTTAAITHRYELLVADPDQPWLPKQGTDEDACDPYDCLPSNVGTVDRQSGEVRAGKGNYPRTFAVAELSVGEKAATYPLVFEPRSSFPAPAPPPPVPVAVPAPPPPPAAAPPTTPQVNLPSAPVLPVLTAQALAPPPVPPSPPTFASQAPLDLNLSPAALDVSPPTAVSQPPTPPVNPAPPSGARREARQRQAAAQKSGADSDQESSEAQELGGDTAEAPHGPGHASTRNDFTALAHREQPSAWARDALLGAGLGVAALLLAIGANTARPTPRRREPEQPAPAFARSRRR